MRDRLSVSIVTPAPPRSKTGNRTTALRWAGLLRSLGHRVRITTDHAAPDCDLLVALHAGKSHPAIAAFRQAHPGLPIVVGLAGTDVYGSSSSQEVAASLEAAWRLVALQPLARDAVPAHLRDKVRVIFQSAPQRKGSGPSKHADDHFDVCVIGHLRPVKDPLLIVDAALRVPTNSRLRIFHIGRATVPQLVDEARESERRSPRYHWLGECSRRKTREVLANCRLLVLTSRAEGGANVVSEAIRCGVPVLSTEIAGSIGMLGSDYPAYFPVGDAERLAALLWRAESEPSFMATLTQRCAALADRFDPQREKQAWLDLLSELPARPIMEERARLRIIEMANPEDDVEVFAREVHQGLTKAEKSLPWRYFYDAEGSRLFDAICAQPEYTLPRSEYEILVTHGREIVAMCPRSITLVELGCGSAVKTALLVEALTALQGRTQYAALDVSRSALIEAADGLLRRFSFLEMVAVHGEYARAIPALLAATDAPRLILSLGSNLGNLDRAAAAVFLAGVRKHMDRRDRILIGLDLRKDASRLRSAYDDAAGVTAKFNLNLLARINRELSADFNLDAFAHRAHWDADHGRIQMFLIAQRPQRVHIRQTGLDVDLREGEAIHTENSYKYSREEIAALASTAGFTIQSQWLDSQRDFCETLLASPDEEPPDRGNPPNGNA